MPRLPYRYYALGVMTLVYALTLLDRGLMIILLEPMKRDLGLSDSQLGVVTGLAFGVFYAILGIPLSRWADRGHRVNIAAAATFLWAATVLACAMVGNFLQLAAARVMAGVGEAGSHPPTYSLIGDYFPEPTERARALYLYNAAVPIVSLVGFVLAGWLNERVGWRNTFLILGVPGFFFALLVKATLKEPRAAGGKIDPQPPLPLLEVFRTLWARRSCRNLIIGMVAFFTMGAGLGPWQAAFMMRAHGMATGELGLWMGLSSGLCGFVGLFIGSAVMIGRHAKSPRTQMRLAALSLVVQTPFWLLFLTATNPYLALVSLWPVSVVGNAFLPALFALLQRMVPDSMRATSLAVLLLIANLIGMGAGPLIVGLSSDALRPGLGDVDALRFALMGVVSLLVVACAYLWRAGRTVIADIAEVERRP